MHPATTLRCNPSLIAQPMLSRYHIGRISTTACVVISWIVVAWWNRKLIWDLNDNRIHRIQHRRTTVSSTISRLVWSIGVKLEFVFPNSAGWEGPRRQFGD